MQNTWKWNVTLLFIMSKQQKKGLSHVLSIVQKRKKDKHSHYFFPPFTTKLSLSFIPIHVSFIEH